MIIAFGAVLLVAILISGIANRTVLSTAVLFLIAGFLLGDGVLGVIDLSAGDPTVSLIAQLALFIVLFTDGQRIAVGDLRRAWRLPGRALLFGMPLTFAMTAFLGMLLLGVPWIQAALISAVLAPTDPVLSSAIVGREEIPGRIRHLLSVESGLNDGLALPAVLIFLAIADGEQTEFGLLALELIGGIVLGVAVPLLVALLVRLRFFPSTPLYAALTPVAIACLIFGISTATGANLYLAAFAAGITIATAMPEVRDSFIEFGDYVAEVVKLLALFVFGALISPAVLGDVNIWGYIFCALTLVLARPLAVEVSLIGSRLPWEERATAAWFGPKGFASVLYGLLVLESGLVDATHLFHIIVVAISFSIIAHSSTDVPIARWFAKREQEDRDRAAVSRA
ncbi:NhaP-type Na+/H+ or K+/H+ antiporter [Microbacterium endophyticum]|uniref:NhaP-type Na+/H+ or K+/H+ antiporter n=1 Tax=Microbacterium endophyticum TaxID=1526412 RepID=A0A7W4YM17_9MICO|nr:cation:proton antiporter [Microbacterium endophyticum]MBB2975069.1 NhaP-type Na+/H+ or K+/H+ antiporter [Microbacterium endophyticum]NIK37391.1 NhaP-type Na+/H+ or K+/H+ antiporter [Microbacterium endophyticum]